MKSGQVFEALREASSEVRTDRVPTAAGMEEQDGGGGTTEGDDSLILI